MSWAPWVLGAVVAVVILVIGRLIRSRKSARASYIRQDFLLSAEERQFFHALRKAAGEEYTIFGKIRIDDIITPRSAASADAAWNALQASGEAYFPFVLCKPSDLSIACAIQLIQHQLHGRQMTKNNSNNLKTICVAAGLPLVRLEAGPFYDHHDIRQAVAEAVRKEPLFISEADGRKEPTIAEMEKLEL